MAGSQQEAQYIYMSIFQFLPSTLTFLTQITQFSGFSFGLPHLTKTLPKFTHSNIS
jgi:hypothetical protein